MNYKTCQEQGILRKVLPDKQRAKQLRSMANQRFAFWQRQNDQQFVTLKVEGFYEIIKELIFAHMYEHGYTSTNHICLIAYVQEHVQDFLYESEKIDELRKLRNEITYRGFTIQQDYFDRNEKEFLHIISNLQKI